MPFLRFVQKTHNHLFSRWISLSAHVSNHQTVLALSSRIDEKQNFFLFHHCYIENSHKILRKIWVHNMKTGESFKKFKSYWSQSSFIYEKINLHLKNETEYTKLRKINQLFGIWNTFWNWNGRFAKKYVTKKLMCNVYIERLILFYCSKN